MSHSCGNFFNSEETQQSLFTIGDLLYVVLSGLFQRMFSYKK